MKTIDAFQAALITTINDGLTRHLPWGKAEILTTWEKNTVTVYIFPDGIISMTVDGKPEGNCKTYTFEIRGDH